MMKRKSQRIETLNQLHIIYNNYYKSKVILFCKYFEVDIKDVTVGHSVFITDSNYAETYEKIKNAESYFILLNDYAFILISYSFNRDGEIIKHTLSYVPNIDRKDRYFRIDYAPDKYVENFHSKVHFHMFLDEDIGRIPVDSIVYPNDFLFFILKYIYNDDSPLVDSLEKYFKDTTLSQKELQKSYLRI